MATFGGFSIREYTLKMRSVDVKICWPFGGDGKEKKTKEEMEKLLPPLMCPKYRWWEDELELVRSKQVDERKEKVLEETEKPVSGDGSGLVSEKADLGAGKAGSGTEEEKLAMICPVCRSFTASTVNAVNAHIDNCLAQVSSEEGKQTRTTAEAAAAVKSKTRTLKKRSIVEIFKAAEQIEKAEVDCNEEAEQVSEEDLDSTKAAKASDGVVKRKRKQKMSREEAVAVARKLKLKNKRKKKKKTKKSETAVFDPSNKGKKGKISKLKVPSQADISGRKKVSLHNKRLGKDISDTGVIPKKRQSSMKSSCTQKIVQDSELVPEHQQHEKPVFPIHSILKNRATAISSECSAGLGDIQGGNQINLRRGQQSDKHVRFSGKDDILGPIKKGCPSIDLPQVQSLGKVFPDVIDALPLHDQSMENNKKLSPAIEALEVDGSNENVAVSIRNGTEFLPAHENICLDDNHSCPISPTSPSQLKRDFQDKEKTPDEFVDLNQELQHDDNLYLLNQGNLTASQSLSHVGIPQLLHSTTNRGFNPIVEAQADGNIQGISDTGINLPDPCADSIPRSVAMYSLTNRKANFQFLPSCSATNTEKSARHPFLSQDTTQRLNHCASPYPSLGHLTARDLMSSICPSVEWKKQREAIFRDKCIGEGFIGLPLNSQGELIPLHSSGKAGFPLQKQNTIIGTSSISPKHHLLETKSVFDNSHLKEKGIAETGLTRDNLKLVAEKPYQKENSKVSFSSLLSISGFQYTGGADVHRHDSVRGNNPSAYQFDSDLNLVDIPSSGHKYTSTPHQTEGEKIQPKEIQDCGFPLTTQPTLRLMGKDVTVGVRSKEVQGSEDGKIWTDKEIVSEHRPAIVAPGNSSLKGHFQPELVILPVSEELKETIISSFEPRSCSPLQSIFQEKRVEPKSAHSYLDWQTYVKSQNSFPMINGNPDAQLQNFVHPCPSLELPNQKVRSLDPCISGTESLKMISQIPSPASTPFDGCQHNLLSSAQFNCKQCLECGTKPTLQFPFSNQESGEHLQPSCSQSSSVNLPHWLLNATEQKGSDLTSQPYPNTSAQPHPSTMSGTRFPANPPLNKNLIMSSHNPSNSHPCMKSSSSLASLVYPPLIPVPPGYKSASLWNTTSTNRTKDVRMKSIHPGDPDHEKKFKKRAASKTDNSTKAAKKPTLEMQEVPRSPKELKKNMEFTCHTQYNRESAESDVCGEKASSTGYCPVKIQDECGMSSDHNSSNPDVVTRSGPIKLSAGAKHILKPRQNMSQYNSRPTHSTIPFGAVNTTDNIPEFQETSAKVYRF
ncbi:PREDICTED: uncharacterized protein LOC104608412 [Nelumbo nucifera]|uniref:Uncharacterized protein LOC104608412 n=1 Tax=Nelumbo nucifera TaxID=4432 RepID=A0A1U8B9H3_NELNU|nr:PREDICTED: uncharacterized protein LOC104608412 [Nelumbo nucifera]